MPSGYPIISHGMRIARLLLTPDAAVFAQLTPDAAVFAQLTPTLSHSRIPGYHTGVFWWQDLKYGTVFLLHCDNLTLNVGSSNNFKDISAWRDCSALVAFCL